MKLVKLKTEIYLTTSTKGKGVHPDPVREIHHLWDEECDLIATWDPHKEPETPPIFEWAFSVEVARLAQ
jgi:hypothetical protein